MTTTETQQIQDTLAQVVGALNTLSETVSMLSDRITAIEGRMASLEGRLFGIETRLLELEKRMTALEGTVGGVDRRVTTIEEIVIAARQEAREARQVGFTPPAETLTSPDLLRIGGLLLGLVGVTRRRRMARETILRDL